jgi:hypothetical protein
MRSRIREEECVSARKFKKRTKRKTSRALVSPQPSQISKTKIDQNATPSGDANTVSVGPITQTSDPPAPTGLGRLRKYAKKPFTWLLATLFAAIAVQITSFVVNLSDAWILPAAIADRFASGPPLSVDASGHPPKFYVVDRPEKSDDVTSLAHGHQVKPVADLGATIVSLWITNRRHRPVQITNVRLTNINCHAPARGPLIERPLPQGAEDIPSGTTEIDGPDPIIYTAGAAQQKQPYFEGLSPHRITLDPLQNDRPEEVMQIRAIAKDKSCSWHISIDWRYAGTTGVFNVPDPFDTSGVLPSPTMYPAIYKLKNVREPTYTRMEPKDYCAAAMKTDCLSE